MVAFSSHLAQSLPRISLRWPPSVDDVLEKARDRRQDQLRLHLSSSIEVSSATTGIVRILHTAILSNPQLSTSRPSDWRRLLCRKFGDDVNTRKEEACYGLARTSPLHACSRDPAGERGWRISRLYSTPAFILRGGRVLSRSTLSTRSRGGHRRRKSRSGMRRGMEVETVRMWVIRKHMLREEGRGCRLWIGSRYPVL